jgi:hypothetical protein
MLFVVVYFAYIIMRKLPIACPVVYVSTFFMSRPLQVKGTECSWLADITFLQERAETVTPSPRQAVLVAEKNDSLPEKP